MRRRREDFIRELLRSHTERRCRVRPVSEHSSAVVTDSALITSPPSPGAAGAPTVSLPVDRRIVGPAVAAIRTATRAPGATIAANVLLHQLLFDQIITPRILGGHVGIHPIVAILALLIGNALLALFSHARETRDAWIDRASDGEEI